MRFAAIIMVSVAFSAPAMAFDDPPPSNFEELKRQTFNSWDWDGGGTWDAQEFSDWAMYDAGMNQAQAENAFGQYDANADGSVSFNEYANYGVWA